MNKVFPPLEVYRILFENYGPQGWWPVTPEGGACPGYRPVFSEREIHLNERERFEICLGTILTQNTSWKNAEKALGNLHAAGINSPDKLLNCPPAKLRKLIRPSGFFSQKEKKLRGFCWFLAENHPEGIALWLRNPLKGLREELLSIFGIGPETADSILLYAGGRATFVIDAYAVRLGRRLGWWETGVYGECKYCLEKSLPASRRIFNEFHALIVELGKKHCRKKPLCPGCPLEQFCKSSGERASNCSAEPGS